MNTLTVTADKKNYIKQLHFNLWDSKKNNLHFLDIGILCKNENFNIEIKLPKAERLPALIDLTSKFKDNIPNAIFNASVDIEEKNKVKILKLENNLRYVLSPIDTDKCVNKNKPNEICISVEKLLDSKTNVPVAEWRYYRFRITNFDLSKVIVEVDSKSKSFESSFSACKVIDFRVNDAKLLPVIAAQEIASSADKFEKIHFLYITDINEDIQLADVNYTSRFLEREIWNDYLDLNEQKLDMIAYHLRQKDTLCANFLVKCNYSKTSVKHLIVYALIVIVLAVVANHLPALLKEIFIFLKSIFVEG
ncbi:MAG: hypothetical protein J6I53_01495 [Treponema sp.]|nr:hypothetical protein [Treponema sp.]